MSEVTFGEWLKRQHNTKGLTQAEHALQINRCTFRYHTKNLADPEIVKELRHLAERHPRWGCSKMTDYLRN